jgi:hypothetical protein
MSNLWFSSKKYLTIHATNQRPQNSNMGNSNVSGVAMLIRQKRDNSPIVQPKKKVHFEEGGITHTVLKKRKATWDISRETQAKKRSKPILMQHNFSNNFVSLKIFFLQTCEEVEQFSIKPIQVNDRMATRENVNAEPLEVTSQHKDDSPFLKPLTSFPTKVPFDEKVKRKALVVKKRKASGDISCEPQAKTRSKQIFKSYYLN